MSFHKKETEKNELVTRPGFNSATDILVIYWLLYLHQIDGLHHVTDQEEVFEAAELVHVDLRVDEGQPKEVGVLEVEDVNFLSNRGHQVPVDCRECGDGPLLFFLVDRLDFVLGEWLAGLWDDTGLDTKSIFFCLLFV